MILLFFVSMFVLFGMVSSKLFEIKVRRIHFLADAYHKGDQKLHWFIQTAQDKHKRYKLIINLFIFDFLPAYLYETLVKTKDFVARKYYESADNFRGRRVLKSTGSVSFFLEKLSEDR